MRVVSSFEAKLLQILYAILRPGPIEPILPLLRAQTPRPACLRREAVELVEKALAKGCMRRLAAQGGW